MASAFVILSTSMGVGLPRVARCLSACFLAPESWVRMTLSGPIRAESSFACNPRPCTHNDILAVTALFSANIEPVTFLHCRGVMSFAF